MAERAFAEQPSRQTIGLSEAVAWGPGDPRSGGVPEVRLGEGYIHIHTHNVYIYIYDIYIHTCIYFVCLSLSLVYAYAI